MAYEQQPKAGTRKGELATITLGPTGDGMADEFGAKDKGGMQTMTISKEAADANNQRFIDMHNERAKATRKAEPIGIPGAMLAEDKTERLSASDLIGSLDNEL
jgi:hypothetical protein